MALIIPNKLHGVPEWAKPNPKAPKFMALVPEQLPTAPDSVEWADKVTNDWGMLGNASVGDCVPVCIAHLINLFTACNGQPTPTVMTDEDVLILYSRVAGYLPTVPGTDLGTDPDVAWQYWKNFGVDTPDGNHKIIGYANIDKTNLNAIKLAIDWFGGVGVTWALPQVFQQMQEWTVPPDLNGPNAPYSWGGHQTACGKYTQNTFNLITWGADNQLFDAALFNTPYIVGVTAFITEDWINRTTNQTPNMMDMAALSAAMDKLAA